MFFIFFTVAFLGGMLSLLPSCGPALLPAFFAFSFQQKVQLAKATLFFALGFSFLFLPFSLGLGFVTRLLLGFKTQLDVLVGIILIIFGLLSLFDLSLPVFYSRDNRVSSFGGRNFILGLIFGLTSSACIAPIYGAIITLSFLGQNWLKSFLLLLTFELGLFVPLFLIALFFDKFQFLKSRIFIRPLANLFGRPIFLTNLIATVIFIPLGVFYVHSQTPFLGLATKMGLVSWFLNSNDFLIDFTQTHRGIDFAFVFVAVILIGIFWRRQAKK